MKPTNRQRRRERQLWRLFRQQDGLCLLCGDPMFPQTLRDANFEHMTPRARGGTNAQHNIALSHRVCNTARADAPLTSRQRARAKAWFGVDVPDRRESRAAQKARPAVEHPGAVVMSFAEAAAKVRGEHAGASL